MLKPLQAVLFSLIFLAGGAFPLAQNAAQAQVQAQAPLPEGQQLAMTLLPIVHQGELTYIITPKGYKVQVPGTGVAKNAPCVAVYQDAQRNFWYINKKGEPTQVKPETVQSVMFQLQAQMNAAAQQHGQQTAPQAMAPQMMEQQPGQAPVQQTTIVQQPGTTSNGSGMIAGVNAAAAGMNLAGGILNASAGYGAYGGYGGVPYGRPIYGVNSSGHNNYYYNNNGNKNYVNANKTNQAYMNEFNKQGSWENRNQWSKNIHSGVQPIENAGRRFGGGGRRFR